MIEREVRDQVVDVIKEIQQRSGRQQVDIKGGTQPIEGVPGFDSLNGLEATVELSGRLGFEIPGSINLFVNPEGNKALSVKEIANRIVGLRKKEEVGRG